MLFFLVFALGVIVGAGLKSTDLLKIGKSEKKEKLLASSAITIVDNKDKSEKNVVKKKPEVKPVKTSEQKAAPPKKVEKRAKSPAKLIEKNKPAAAEKEKNNPGKKDSTDKEKNYVTKLDYNKPDFPKTDQGGKYTVQIGSFQNIDAAYNLEKKLGSKGYPSFVIKTAIPEKGNWYRVRVGTFNNKEKAAVYAKKLQKTENLDYTQVTINK